MSWVGELSLDELLALKPRGSFRVESIEGRQVLTISRPGQPLERILCHSPGHANQLRMQLTDEGLTGFIEGAR